MDHTVNHISGLSGHLHVRQPVKGIPTHWHVPSLEQTTVLALMMMSPERNPIISLQTPQQWPHTLYLSDSDSVFYAGKPPTDSEVKEKAYCKFLTREEF